MHQRILDTPGTTSFEEAAVVLGDAGDESCSANASIQSTRIHEEVVCVRRDAVRHAGKCRQYPRRLCGLGGEVRMNVGDVAPADRRNETRGQDDDREAIHERPRVGRVVEQHVTNYTRDNPWSRDREAQQLEAPPSGRGDLHYRKPPVRHRVHRAATTRAKCEQFNGGCDPISHGVEFAKYECLGDQREPQDHVRHSGAGRGFAIATGHAVQR